MSHNIRNTVLIALLPSLALACTVTSLAAQISRQVREDNPFGSSKSPPGNFVRTDEMPVFPLIGRMSGKSGDAEKKQLAEEITKIKTWVESRVGVLPYETPDLLERISRLEFGERASDVAYRYIRDLEFDPRGFSGLEVVNCHVIRPDAKSPHTSARDSHIRNALLVVNGAIHTTGSISDSIVISAGPIRCEQGIENSLVICLAEENIAVHCSEGYIENSVVVAPSVKSDSVRKSIIAGKILDQEGNDISEKNEDKICNEQLLPSLLRACQPRHELRFTPAQLAPSEKSVPASKVVDAVIESKVKAEKAALINFMAELTVAEKDVKRLIDDMNSANSEEQKSLAMHAVRICRSRLAREALAAELEELEADHAVRFLLQMDSVDRTDVATVGMIYNKFATVNRDKARKVYRKKITDDQDVGQAVVQLLAIDWSRADDWSSSGRFNEKDFLAPDMIRQIQDDREEKSISFQRDLVVWLIKNSNNDQHKIYALARMQSMLGTGYVSRIRRLQFEEAMDILLVDIVAPDLARQTVEMSRYDLIKLMDKRFSEATRLAAIDMIPKKYFSPKNSSYGGSSAERRKQAVAPIEEQLKRLEWRDKSQTVMSAATDMLEDVKFFKTEMDRRIEEAKKASEK